MSKYMIYLLTFIIISISTKYVSSESLQSQNQDHLNPVNDYEFDSPNKDQDKRTIFGNSLPNYGWAKHVGVHPSGAKYIIGYGPVDLKYLPIARPISIRPHRPIKKPLVLKPVQPVHHHDIWKAVSKPTINVPAPPHLPNKPWQHDGWSATKPVYGPPLQIKPDHHHHHIKPVQPAFVPSKPLIPVQPVSPVIPVVPAPQPVPVPVAPVIPLKPVLPQPVIPQSAFFEVTRPNLPVLPFGASFPSSLLQFVPTSPGAIQVAQPLPVAPIPQPPHHALVPVPPPHHHHHYPETTIESSGGVIHIPQHHHHHEHPIHDHHIPIHHHHPPGTIVEYHGTHNFVPIAQPQPALIGDNPRYLPQHPIIHHFPAQPQPQPQPQQPQEQHDVQTPLIPQNHPLFLQNQHAQSQLIQQLLAQQNQQYHQDINHFSQQHDFNDQAVIQPGQTDLQLPLHLPQHPNYVSDGRPFQPGNFHDPSQHPENVFRPSISLEPPFTDK